MQISGVSLQIFDAQGVPIHIQSAEPAGEGPYPAILLLHGAGGNAERWFDYLAPLPQRASVGIYAVHYFDRTGTLQADRETIEDGKHVPLWLDTVERALDHLASLPQVDRTRIALAGISLGAYLSLATAATDPKRIRAVVDISGGLIEPWASQATASFPPTLIVHGEADPVVPVAEAYRLERRLSDLGVAHEVLILAGEGHWFSPAGNLRILAAVAGFLTRHLK